MPLSKRHLALAFFLGGFVIAALTGSARAQPEVPPDERPRTGPRYLFQQGLLAAQEGRWLDARSAFEQSYALAPRPITLLNLAGAWAQTGRLVESARGYRRFLVDSAGTSAERLRPQAEEALRTIEARIPTVRIQLQNARPGDRVLLDGEPLDRDALARPIDVDPGRHEVRVMREATSVRASAIEVSARERATVVLDLTATESATPPRSTRSTRASRRTPRSQPSRASRSARRDADDDATVLESPWLWIAIGAVAIGAGATVGIAASQSGREPTSGDIEPFRRGL